MSRRRLFFQLLFSALVFLNGVIAVAQTTQGKAAEWERTVEAAKKEGRVVVSIPTSAELRKEFESGFQKAFPAIELELSVARGASNINKIVEEHSYQLYKDWIAPDFPRMVVIEIQHATPYYDDSYAVNSANLGPYGDAITYELIPYIEQQFRCIGKGWARFLYGGSTGGWEALAAQVLYPDEYNGCWAACPDPVDFRAYTVVNIYEHENAYFTDGKWKHVPAPV